jgi:hypothetical protein
MVEKKRKRVAFERIHAMRFKLLSLRMSLSQNHCAFLRDMHETPHGQGKDENGRGTRRGLR